MGWRIVGIDVSKAKLDVCLLGEAGEEVDDDRGPGGAVRNAEHVRGEHDRREDREILDCIAVRLDGALRPGRKLAAVGCFFTCQDTEQRTFSHAVAGHQRNFIALVYMKTNVVEKRSNTVSLGKIFY